MHLPFSFDIERFYFNKATLHKSPSGSNTQWLPYRTESAPCPVDDATLGSGSRTLSEILRAAEQQVFKRLSLESLEPAEQLRIHRVRYLLEYRAQ